ncbi:DUF6415 family natural product biosynthesis protein [Streptomyces sp. LP11]|uniref:DUF6415 family natural product biosynthesis protein n=1 Tax=Streptomyces pyxinicus TaxID=2970331 RepID=A0ABT2B2Q8_9ACTN|nr:DUF6415 family natural product biosynthesis protein [Streptomyces sp. LP11]MCS0602671.1 DUF6415 family natural product biosynthesis protein [Streptomyces sp. LP11]
MTKTAQAAADTATAGTDLMRSSIALLLPHDTVRPPAGEKLAALTATLRGHMESLIPQVERIAALLPEDDIPRYCAVACVSEARVKLSARAGTAPGEDVVYARRLARTLSALCDHYEALTGRGMCVACDRPIRAGDDTAPYDRAGNSGGTVTSTVHAACAPSLHPAH